MESHVNARVDVLLLAEAMHEEKLAHLERDAIFQESEEQDTRDVAVHYAAEAREAQARADNAARFADRAAAVAAVARAKHAEQADALARKRAELPDLLEEISHLEITDERVLVDKKWRKWLTACERVQESMAAGDVAGALVADRELAAATLASQLAGDAGVLDPRARGGEAVFWFAEPPAFGVPTEAEVEAAMKYVKEERPTCESELAELEAMILAHRGEKRARPKGLNETALQVVRDVRGRVAKFHEGIVRSGMVVEHDSEEEEEEEEEADGSGAEEEEQEDRRARRAREKRERIRWNAIAKSVPHHISALAAARAAAARGPRAASSPAAVYNSKSHFAFESDEAVATVNRLDDAVRCCCLRARPKSWIRDEGATRLPLNLRVHAINAMSIEGDLIAVTGNAHPGDFMGRSEGEYAGFMRVPRPSLLATRVDGNWTYSPLGDWSAAPTIDNIRDAAKTCPYDMVRTKRFKHKGCWYGVVAAAGKIWAADIHYKAPHVCAFDPARSRRAGPVARLDFPESTRKLMRGFANWRPSLCRAGEAIVAAPGDNSLCVWSVGTALARGFETAYNWREDDESDDDCLLESSFSSDSGADAPPPPPAASPSPEKRPKLDYGPDAVVAAGEASLLLGDVVALPGTTSVVCAPVDTSFLDKPERPWTSLRVVDIDRGEVTRVLAGHTGAPGLSTQYIRDLVFSFDPYQAEGLVFDVRAARPAFVLPKCGPVRLNPFAAHDGVMIGVPLPGGYPAAFTAGADEVIRCWDLRQPSSHAYTLSTGNQSVRDMHWHAPTASLFAVTENPHAVSYGRYTRMYQYGECINERIEDGPYGDAEKHGDWPKGAQRSREYFAEKFNLADEPLNEHRFVLQYAFDDGRPLTAARESVSNS